MRFTYLPVCAAENSVEVWKQLAAKSVEKGINISSVAKVIPCFSA